MHAGNRFTIREVFLWTRRETFVFLVVASIPTIIYALFDLTWIRVPWLPIALVGTAVAFLVGFKNNATYDRLWEARKIWGAIVNSSRSWGIMAKDFVTNKYALTKVTEKELQIMRTRLIHRHIGWLTALRFQLRQSKAWENMHKNFNREYRSIYKIPEWENDVGDMLGQYMTADELNYVMSKSNQATQILAQQSRDLRELASGGFIDDFRHMEMENMLVDFFTQQGKCERIKNFPYPRQFATINLYFVWIFIVLVPFGMVGEFDKLGEHFVWLTIPFSTLVAWIFHTMEKIGEATENPFEGGANDIPMAALCRTIEIDLREMLDEQDIPEGVKPMNNILM